MDLFGFGASRAASLRARGASQETLASAANDAEMVMDETRRLAVEYQEKLEELFLGARNSDEIPKPS